MLYFAPCSLWKRLITPYISFKINSLLFCFKLTMNGSFTLAIASWKIANIWTSLSLFWEMALFLESWWKNQFFVCAVWRKEHLTGKYCSSSQNFRVKFYSAGYVINVNTFDESLSGIGGLKETQLPFSINFSLLACSPTYYKTFFCNIIFPPFLL